MNNETAEIIAKTPKRALPFFVAILVLSAFFLFPSGETSQVNDWESPLVVSRNTEPAHATLVPYSTIEKAIAGERLASEYMLLLNGKWKFRWVPKPADRPLEFYKTEYDASRWKDLDVPGNWQFQGKKSV